MRVVLFTCFLELWYFKVPSFIYVYRCWFCITSRHFFMLRSAIFSKRKKNKRFPPRIYLYIIINGSYIVATYINTGVFLCFVTHKFVAEIGRQRRTKNKRTLGRFRDLFSRVGTLLNRSSILQCCRWKCSSGSCVKIAHEEYINMFYMIFCTICGL